MFACSQCPERYKLEDVQEGRYFPSTGVCLNCYQSMYKSKARCFGKKKMYDSSTVACGQECQDSVICKSFINHRKEY
jgi:hypothetical protein